MIYYLVCLSIIIQLYTQGLSPIKPALFNWDLESLKVLSLLKDSNGLLWIGTENGLYKYNGVHLHLIPSNSEEKNSLKNPHILSLYESSDHTLWIGTELALSALNPSLGTFTHYTRIHGDSSGLIDPYIHSIVEDSAKNLWLGTDGGLTKFSPKTNRFTHFLPHNSSLSFYHVTHTFIDSDHHLWVGTTLYLNKYLGEQSFSRHPAKRNSNVTYHYTNATYLANRIITMHESSDKKLWIGTDYGVSLFDLKTDRYIHQQLDLNATFKQLKTSVRSILEIDKERTLLGTSEGLYLISIKGKIATCKKLLSNEIYTLIKDHSIIWIGTNKGVFFTEIQKFPININSQFKDVTVINSQKDKLWVGHKRGVSYINKLSGQTNFYWPFFKITQLVFEDKHIWFTGLQGDLEVVDWKSNKGIRYNKGVPVNNITFPNTHIEDAVYISETNDMWFAAYNEGLLHLDMDKKRVNTILLQPTSTKVNRILKHGKQLLLGTTHGLISYSLKDSSEQLITPNINVQTLYTDRTHIWLGTLQHGVLQSDTTGKILAHLNTTDGLQVNHVVGISSYQNTLYILTKRGLSSLKDGVLNEVSVAFQTSANLHEFYTLHIDSLGTLYLGSSAGLYTIKHHDIRYKNEPSKTFITQVKMNQDDLISPLNVAQNKTFKIPYDKNTISFEFSSSNYTQLHQRRFQYKLTPLEDRWISSGQRNFVTYRNLNPGTYTFMCRSKHSNSEWTEAHTRSFFILKPYWQQWWFILLSCLFFASIIYGFYLNRKEKRTEVKRIRKQIAADIHDHIGSTLTEITLLSELAQIHPESNKDELEKIEQKSRRSITEMSDLVWAIDTEKDTVEDLVLRMKEFSLNLLSYNEMTTYFNLDIRSKHQRISPNKRQHIYFIFKEMIHNIVKHSEATEVHISIHYDTEFYLLVKDNGIGLTNETDRSGNGLRNMKQRSEQIQATFKIKSEHGTQLQLKLKQLV